MIAGTHHLQRGELLEAPAGLAELGTPAKTEYRPGYDLVGSYPGPVLAGSVALAVVEGAIADGVAPLIAVLRNQRVGKPLELRVVGQADGISFDHDVQPFPQRFAPVSTVQCGFASRFFAFRSSGPVQK